MYVFYCNNPAGNVRAGDCVIRAICKVTGDTWEKAYTELSVEGYELRDWGNANHVWDTYLRKQGFKRYICPNDCPFCYSINDFANEYRSHWCSCCCGSRRRLLRLMGQW